MKQWILAVATMVMIYGVEAMAQQPYPNQWNPPPCCQRPCPRPCPKPPKQPCPKQICPKPPCIPKTNPCCPPVCFEQGLASDPKCMPAAYSTPAGIDIREGQNIRFSLSILYWEAMQDGMDLAIPGQAASTSPIPATSATLAATGHGILTQEFEYQPGFKAGFAWLGAKDSWVVYGEYTRLHGHARTSNTSPPGPGATSLNGIPVPGAGVWMPTSWLAPNAFENSASKGISSEWRYGIDLVDGQISRPFYSGTRYAVEPFFGARAAWIDQKFQITSLSIPTSVTGIPSPTQTGRYTSDSWAVGPRVGMNGNWFLGRGVRFVGNAAASLLFTQYTRVSENVSSPDLPVVIGGVLDTGLPLNVDIKKVNCLRPNLDLTAGLGWGTYFHCRRVYLDFSATYDFSLFWEQNMMRALADQVTSFVGSTAGNLYLHGLTARLQASF